MNDPAGFGPKEIENIVRRFGQAFYEKATRDMETYATRWGLSSYRLIPSFSANLVLFCQSERYGDAVLKIGNPSYLESELHALQEYRGRRFCEVFDADPANGVLLEERVRPGNPLREESSLEKRLSVFCSLHEGLHIPPARPDVYPAYAGWVGRIADYMSKRQDCPELYSHMKKAHGICLAVSALYPRKMLLHGDFHHDNILLGKGGEYRIIDPKGVIGDPVFDIPRFILNEFDDDVTPEIYRKINEIIGVLERKLNIPNDILRQCLYVETAMGVCWSVEDGAVPEDYPKLLSHAAFAEALLNS